MYPYFLHFQKGAKGIAGSDLIETSLLSYMVDAVMSHSTWHDICNAFIVWCTLNEFAGALLHDDGVHIDVHWSLICHTEYNAPTGLHIFISLHIPIEAHWNVCLCRR